MSDSTDTPPTHGFVPPPHINEEPHRRLMERLRAMTPREVLAAAVRAGIYDEQGKLTASYRDEEDQDAQERSVG